MVSFKAVLMFFIGVHLLSSFFILFPRSTSEAKRELKITSDLREFLGFNTKSVKKLERYKFVRFYLANKILTELNVETQIDNTNMQIGKGRAYLGFQKDNIYCAKRQAYFAYYSESLFKEMKIVHAHDTTSFVGDIVSFFAKDLHAANIQNMTAEQKSKQLYEMMPSANAFFTPVPLHFFYDINKQCSCLSQIYNHIPGCDNLARKHKLAQAITTYMKNYEERPQCLSYNRLFPQSWVLSNADECQQFFEKLNSPEYEQLKNERTIVYIRKLASARKGQGVQPLSQNEEISLRKQYKNGSLCGQVNNDIIMQHYIHNPLLLNGQKFEFKTYLLIASVNPLIAYYHDGFLKISSDKHDTTSNDKKTLLTNLALSEQIHDGVSNEDQMDQEELKEAQQWNFDRLQIYLLEQGLISDPNWLDNYLRPEFKKVLIHLVRLSSNEYVRHSSYYGLFSVDFMLDEDLQLWFIEANAAPEFGGYSKSISPIISQMLKDHFEIVFGLLRSRMKRVINYVNSLVEDGSVREIGDDKITIEDVEFHREKFKEITMNYFEKEFEVSESNGFEKIIDENDNTDAVYQGIMGKDCL